MLYEFHRWIEINLAPALWDIGVNPGVTTPDFGRGSCGLHDVIIAYNAQDFEMRALSHNNQFSNQIDSHAVAPTSKTPPS